MFCKLCGKVSSDNKCMYCGHKVNSEYNSSYGSQSGSTVEVTDSVNSEKDINLITSPINTQATLQIGMKWYKFLIYFALFAGAVINLITGIMTISGMTYRSMGVEPALVYDAVKGLKVLDVVFGLCYIGLAVLGVVTRFKLSGMQKSGPKFLYAFYVVNVLLLVIYNVVVAKMLNVPMNYMANIVSVAINVVMIILNVIYFKKRESLFVN